MNKNYTVFGDSKELNEYKVVVDGKEENKFGKTFVGTIIDDYDIAEMSIRAYLSDNGDYNFSYVDNEIIEYKNNNQEYIDNMPKYIFCSNNVKAELVAYTDNNRYYLDNDGEEKFIVTDTNNTVLTDMECFFISAIVEDYKSKELTFLQDIQYWLDEYVE